MSILKFNKTSSTNKTFTVVLKKNSKLQKKAIKNSKAIFDCEVCHKALEVAIKKEVDKVEQRFVGTVYNGYTETIVMNAMEEATNFALRQVKIGVGLKSDCKKHKKIIENAPILFNEIISTDSYIKKIS